MGRDEEGLAEEHLLAFPSRDPVAVMQIRGITVVPIEARTLEKAIEDVGGHDNVYTQSIHQMQQVDPLGRCSRCVEVRSACVQEPGPTDF
jgi:hypothetical protein